MRRFWLLTIAALGATSYVGAAEPDPTTQVVATREDGIMATGINARGEIVGFEWLEEKERPGVLYQAPFYAKGTHFTYLPLLKGYTATFPAAVSDDGLVVGRVSKPASPAGPAVLLRNQAFVWDAKGGIRGLGALEGDVSSFASDVTSDGRRISGFSLGLDRVRACIWDRDGDGWKGTALPHESRLGSNVVVMSDDGKSIAAVDGSVPCLWTENPSGAWTREVIGERGSLLPRGINNAADVVGFHETREGLRHAIIWTRTKGRLQLDKPETYVLAEASAINNHGLVVGMVDGPPGSKIGPRAFTYQDGQLRLIDQGGPSFTAATCVNDRGQLAGIVEKGEDAPEVVPPQKPETPR